MSNLIDKSFNKYYVYYKMFVIFISKIIKYYSNTRCVHRAPIVFSQSGIEKIEKNMYNFCFFMF